MLRDAFSSTTGDATSIGWISNNVFLHVLEHFVSHVRLFSHHPELIIVEKYETHASLKVIFICELLF